MDGEAEVWRGYCDGPGSGSVWLAGPGPQLCPGFVSLCALLTAFSVILVTIPSFKNRLFGQFGLLTYSVNSYTMKSLYLEQILLRISDFSLTFWCFGVL